MKDIRDAFFDEVYEIGSQDKDVMVITNDMDVFSLRRFKEEFPKQFINIGVAEQNMVNVAAGLASCGKKVIIYGIASFTTFRCFEQIKFNICSMQLPVTIVGMGAGLSFAFDGPTHHSIQDIAAARALPELEIWNPCDTISAQFCSKTERQSSPKYVRIDKGEFNDIYKTSDECSAGYKQILEGDILLVSTGYMTHVALEVAHHLSSKAKVGVVDVVRLKPLADIERCLRKSSHVITLEEHSVVGGLGSMVGELILSSSVPVKLSTIGLMDGQYLDYGTREWFHSRYGIDTDSVIREVQQLCDI